MGEVLALASSTLVNQPQLLAEREISFREHLVRIAVPSHPDLNFASNPNGPFVPAGIQPLHPIGFFSQAAQIALGQPLPDTLELSKVDLDALKEIEELGYPYPSGDKEVVQRLQKANKLSPETYLKAAKVELQKLVGAEVTGGNIAESLKAVNHLLRMGSTDVLDGEAYCSEYRRILNELKDNLAVTIPYAEDKIGDAKRSLAVDVRIQK